MANTHNLSLVTIVMTNLFNVVSFLLLSHRKTIANTPCFLVAIRAIVQQNRTLHIRPFSVLTGIF